MKAKDTQPGQIFKEAGAKGDGLLEQRQYLRCWSQYPDVVPVVNIANWVHAQVEPDTEVVVIGQFTPVRRRVLRRG